MHRRAFVHTLGATLAMPLAASRIAAHVAPHHVAPHRVATRRLKRIGIQLYSLRDAGRANLERTLADIAAAGYTDVELLASMDNFGMPPAQLRATLQRLGLRSLSTHTNSLADIERQLDAAHALGHEYVVLASLPEARRKTLDDHRYWADELNRAGRVARAHGMWIAFHDEPENFVTIDGRVAYDVLVERTDPAYVRLQLDTGNAAMGGRDPLDLMRLYADRYWLFHIKDAPSLGAKTDTELGKGVVDLRTLLRRIPRIDERILYVEQETYPGAPLDSAKRDHDYLATLDF
ncbi:MAG: TIM barrel protein [Gemmatirosa sp.]|nr:TIM barrel protein [Gemmatirosa sp.]